MKSKLFIIILVAAVFALGSCAGKAEKNESADPASDRSAFVVLTDVVPDVILEIRYYSTYNFVGARVDGYEQPLAMMTKVAADSLHAVSDELMAHGYRVKIYDAYRPQRAVDHFVRWAADLGDTVTRMAFYPYVDKSELFDKGYICARSGHTRGSTVDLTLVDAISGKELDMGGVFDWFGIESHPNYCGNPDTGEYNAEEGVAKGLTEEQFRNRMLLRNAMVRHGFKTIDEEWWHFTLRDEPFPDTYFNFPVKME